MSSGIVHERFLAIIEAATLTADGLTSTILTTLANHQLDFKKVVSQCYDGASVMSGGCSSVQECIQRIASQARYIHCYAHILNLVLVDSVKYVKGASEVFALVQTLYVFVSTTKAHIIFMSRQNELYPDKQPRQLQHLSDTRWTC